MRYRELILAATAFALSAAPAGAQLGALKKKMEDAMAKKDTAASGMAKVKATIEWNVEMTSAEKVPRHADRHDDYQVTGAATRVLHGSVTASLHMDPHALPGGGFARAASNGGAPYSIMFATQSGAGDLAGMTGTVSHTLRITETGAACKVFPDVMGSVALSNPGRLAANGQVALTAKNTQLAVSFRGDAPVSANVIVEPTVAIKGRASNFSCGGKRPPGYDADVSVDRDYTEPAIGLNFGMSTDTPSCESSKNKSGNVMTVTSRCEQPYQDGGKMVTTTTLTWDAPPTPAGDVKMADAPKLEGGGAGSITFTQNGKEAKWPMNSLVNIAGPVNGITVMYTPDGGQPSNANGVLALTVMNVRGTVMVGLNLSKGPSGDTTFEADQCTAQSATVGGKTEGSGECRKGNTVVKFTFTAAK